VTKLPITERYNDAVIGSYLTIFHNHADHVQRVTDTIQVEGSTLRRSITLDLTVPAGKELTESRRANPLAEELATGRLPSSGPRPELRTMGSQMSLLPVMRGLRGRLFDNLDVRDAAGRALPVLSQAENKALASTLLETEFTEGASGGLDMLALAWRAASTIAAIPYLPPTTAAWVYGRYFKDPETLARFGITGESWRYLNELASFFCDRFMITVELDAAPLDRVLLKYSYDNMYREDPQFIEEELGQDPPTSGLRRLLGQSPYSFRIRLPMAFIAQSYHFRMEAPANLYCARQYFLASNEGAAVSGAQTTTNTLTRWHPPPPKGIQSRRTQATAPTYAHLYVNGLQDQDHFPLFARIIFYEVPPGTAGVTLIACVATSLGLVTVAAASLAFVRANGVGASVASIIIALPATVAFWLQPSTDGRELLTVPLSSRLGLLASGLVAYLGALCLVVMQAVAPVSSWWKWLFQGILGLLACGSLLNTVAISRKVAAARRRYEQCQKQVVPLKG
jgi:hypothetical protein